MSAVAGDVIRLGPEQARAGAWEKGACVAYLLPLPQRPPLSVSFVRRATAELAARGFRRVVTNALAPGEQQGFLAAGFEVEERLDVLAHDLGHVPPAPPVGLRRARRRDREPVLAVDACAFPPFWRLDDARLEHTLAVTPRARFRIADGGAGGHVVAYAVTGRSARQGFLQRVAVHPHHQRQGLGRALVVDALRWLRRWGARRAVVNTQVDNRAALALYEDLGFRREPSGLTVLSKALVT